MAKLVVVLGNIPVALLAAFLLVASPSLASGQMCAGTPKPNLAWSADFADGGKGLAFWLVPSSGPAFATIGFRVLWLDGITGVHSVTELGGGAEIDVGGKRRVFVCPLINYRSGLFDEDTQTSTWQFGVGASVGVVALRTDGASVVPSVGLLHVYSRTTTTFCCYEPLEVTGPALVVGVGLNFRAHLGIRPYVSFPLTVEGDSDLSIGVYVGLFPRQ